MMDDARHGRRVQGLAIGAEFNAVDRRIAAHVTRTQVNFVTDELDSYLQPKVPAAADPDAIRRSGRGVTYTRSAFAYLFQLA